MIRRLLLRLAAQRGVTVHLESAPQLRQYEAIADRLARDRPGRVLDWGCGFGQVTQLLRERGVDVTAFDYRSDVEHDGFRPLERYPQIEAYISSDPVRLPFEDGSFGAVLSCGVLEHVHDPDASIEELRRVLRPGGTFYVYNLPNRYSYLERIAKLLGLYYHGQLPDDRVYSKREAVELLEKHGFQVREARRANMLPLTLRGRLAASAAGGIWAASRALAAVPGLNLFATSLELVAVAR